MTTRAGMAFSSHRAKQNLMKLLFDNKTTNSMVSSSTSYTKLRSAYLEKLQELHPDKYVHENLQKDNSYQGRNTTKQHNHNDDGNAKLERKALFVKLQDAWETYSHLFKQEQPKQKHKKENHNEDANFTMFGVGCSFADSPEETKYRNEIMDQASRGWFSAGALMESIHHHETAADEKKINKKQKKEERISLCDEDLFIPCQKNEQSSNEQKIDIDRKWNSINLQSSLDPSQLKNDSSHSKKKKCLVDLPSNRRTFSSKN